MIDTPQAEMPRYVCHKTVHALKIIHLECKLETGMPVYLYPQRITRCYAPIKVTQEWCRKHNVPTVSTEQVGYYVVHADGYTSWSPVEAFEKGYTLEHVADVYNRAFREDMQSTISNQLNEIEQLKQRIATLVEDNNAVRQERDVLKARLAEHGVALQSVQHSSDSYIGKECALEAALTALAAATDGSGRFVVLHPSLDYSAISLRKTITDVMHIDFDNIQFFGRDSVEKTQGMIAWYRNLALLANATAAALDLELLDSELTRNGV